jgi:hypothetical protein
MVHNLKNIAPYICKVIKKYAYKNNNLILLFSLIGEIVILPHLPGKVNKINSLFDLNYLSLGCIFGQIYL